MCSNWWNKSTHFYILPLVSKTEIGLPDPLVLHHSLEIPNDIRSAHFGKYWSRLLWAGLWTFGFYEIGGISSNCEGLLAVGARNKYLSLLRNFIKESEKNMTKIIVVFPEIGLFRPADEGTTALRNVGKYSLKYSSPLPRRPGSWATQPWRNLVARSCLVTGL